jgi:aspartyl-tRNA(Asn)/glutamyl-tRNA(Gln) amidotransferase subunit B
MKLEPVIGLEIHVQLKTNSKMFCSCSNDGENRPPNTTVCPVCLGHPGVLPVPNKRAVDFAIKAGLALNCTIRQSTKFDRKNYFYPDLPKAYQISQFDEPIAEHGFVEIILDADNKKRFGITRLHLEEDAAKNTHGPDGTLVDYNRGGTPLIEIVSEPDFRSSHEAKLFLQELRAMMRYLGVSDADMEKGHLRCDANISLRPEGVDTLFPKTEIKNLNSFKAVERALEYEIHRQTKLWEAGDQPQVETTRGWNEDNQETVLQRTKETAQDYRYFPEPDIPRLEIGADVIESIGAQLPELPLAKRQRFFAEYGLNLEIINQLVLDQEQAHYFEAIVSELQDWITTEGHDWNQAQEKCLKLATGWFLSKYPTALDKYSLTLADQPVTPENFAELLTLIYSGAINQASAVTVLEKMVDREYAGQDPSHIIDELGLKQLDNDDELESMAREIMAANQPIVEQYRAGKVELLNFFLGQMMKASKGTANPQTTREILQKLLNE